MEAVRRRGGVHRVHHSPHPRGLQGVDAGVVRQGGKVRGLVRVVVVVRVMVRLGPTRGWCRVPRARGRSIRPGPGPDVTRGCPSADQTSAVGRTASASVRDVSLRVKHEGAPHRSRACGHPRLPQKHPIGPPCAPGVDGNLGRGRRVGREMGRKRRGRRRGDRRRGMDQGHRGHRRSGWLVGRVGHAVGRREPSHASRVARSIGGAPPRSCRSLAPLPALDAAGRALVRAAPAVRWRARRGDGDRDGGRAVSDCPARGGRRGRSGCEGCPPSTSLRGASWGVRVGAREPRGGGGGRRGPAGRLTLLRGGEGGVLRSLRLGEHALDPQGAQRPRRRHRLHAPQRHRRAVEFGKCDALMRHHADGFQRGGRHAWVDAA